MAFVRQLANKVTVLHQGHILCEGSLDEVQNDERVIEVYLGKKKINDATHAEH
jgi:urea transport system ATP-binding protein